MKELRKQLPQLDYLLAFEAAARLNSFTKAAVELNITQSAVSQQIRNLEQHLDLLLFERAHKSVRLTEAGKVYHNSVSLALVHLLSATNKVRGAAEQNKLTVATDVTTASLWLSPRIHRFHERNPHIQIRLIASDVQEAAFADDIDIGITHGDGQWTGVLSEPLFQETVFPVCSPEYLKENPISTIDDMLGARLIELEYEHWSWMNWTIWFTEQGLPLGKNQSALICNSYPSILEAAAQGMGVALGWSYFVDDRIIDGSLVRPLAEEVKTSYAYHIVTPYSEYLRQEVQDFRDWLLEERDFCS